MCTSEGCSQSHHSCAYEGLCIKSTAQRRSVWQVDAERRSEWMTPDWTNRQSLCSSEKPCEFVVTWHERKFAQDMNPPLDASKNSSFYLDVIRRSFNWKDQVCHFILFTFPLLYILFTWWTADHTLGVTLFRTWNIHDRRKHASPSDSLSSLFHCCPSSFKRMTDSILDTFRRQFWTRMSQPFDLRRFSWFCMMETSVQSILRWKHVHDPDHDSEPGLTLYDLSQGHIWLVGLFRNVECCGTCAARVRSGPRMLNLSSFIQFAHKSPVLLMRYLVIRADKFLLICLYVHIFSWYKRTCWLSSFPLSFRTPWLHDAYFASSQIFAIFLVAWLYNVFMYITLTVVFVICRAFSWSSRVQLLTHQ